MPYEVHKPPVDQPLEPTIQALERRALPSLEQYIDDPSQLREALTAHGLFDFAPLPSGLMPACGPAAKTNPEAGKDMGQLAWMRDNTYIGRSLAKSPEPRHQKQAINIAQAMLSSLQQQRTHILDGVVNGRLDPSDPYNRLAVRVHGDNLERDNEPRVQNDSAAYPLILIGELALSDMLKLDDEDLDTLAQTANYLGHIKYWQDADEGAWEEDRQLRASSIGVAIAGLSIVKQLLERRGHNAPNIPFDQWIDKGKQAMQAILPAESRADAAWPDRLDRQVDASHLLLLELGVLTGQEARATAERITDQLQRPHGFARYQHDTYWGPNYQLKTDVIERTKAAPGSLESRNAKMDPQAIATEATQAQWTLFDPILSAYWGREYMTSGDAADRQRQLHHLERSLGQIVANADGNWQLPEAYSLITQDQTSGQTIESSWQPNPHSPLYWSAANLHTALDLLEKTATPSKQ